MRLYLMALVIAVFAAGLSVGRSHPLSATGPTTIVVSPGNMQNWAFGADPPDPAGTGTLDPGPATPPAGIGSARMTLSGTQRELLYLGATTYAGTRFSDITTLSYSTYQTSSGVTAISLQFDVDYDLTDLNTSWQGRLVFEPYNAFTVLTGTWQTWDALAGKWWATGGAGTASCPQATPCTWAQILSLFPNAGIRANDTLLFKAGGPWPGFDGNVDNFTIGVSGSDTAYDFEPNCQAACYVRPDGSDANPGTADTPALAKQTIQNGIDTVQPGGTVYVAAGTYVEQLDIGKPLSLKGAGIGVTVVQSPASLATKFTTSAANKPVVYVHGTTNASDVEIALLTVDGNGAANANYRMSGIAFYNAGGTVRDSEIVRVRETPLSGTQQGVGIYALNDDSVARTIVIRANLVNDYQKNGMALNGAGLTATVDANQVTGAGTTSLIAQNGIQIGFGAVGSITGNSVKDNDCTAAPDCTADPTSASNADGAAGILLYQPGAGTVTVSGNILTGNQFGVWTVAATSIDVNNNSITGGPTANGIAVWDCDQWCAPGDAVGTTGTITANTISGHKYGLIQRDFVAGAPTPAVVVRHNNITGAVTYGAWSDVAFDATDNWWGSANGPQHVSNTFNVGSQGVPVSDNVAFVPWWDAAWPAGASFAPVTTTSPAGSYASIQAGVNASNAGGTVNAAAGVFTENVTVGQQVTVAGAGAPSTRVIPAVSNANPCAGSSLCGGAASNVFLVQADNVTIEDLTVDGDNPTLTSGIVAGGADLDARNGIITNYLLGLYNNLEVHNVTTKNIYLRGIYAASGGTFNFHDDTVQNVQAEPGSIAMFNFGGSGVFANNTVSDANDAIASNWSTGTQYLNNVITASGSGVHTDNNGGSGGVADLIQGNTVSACKTDGYGVWTFSPYVNPTVQENTVTGCAVGLAAAGQSSPATTSFVNNKIDGTGGTTSSGPTVGVFVTTDRFGFGATNVAATFTGTIVTNTGQGFLINADPTFTGTVSARFNSIAGNAAGLVTTGTGTLSVTGTENWWGSDTGPTHAANPGGTGDSVANGVTYSPWLGIGTDAAPATGFQLASPMTWIAGPAVCGATCIQAAIDDASNGDTVKAKSGIFNEHVTVNKSITLTAASNPIIDGGGTGTGITITANGVSVSSFEVRNVTDGVVISNAANVTLSGNNIHAFHQRGVSVDGAANALVDNNTIDGEAGGTTASPGTNPDTDTRYYGVFAVDSTGTISNNVIKGITHGPSNGLQSGVGVRLAARAGNAANMTISGNDISDVQKNAIVVTDFYGGTAVNANVSGNTVAGNGPINYIAQNGIQVSNGATATVANNDVSGYDYTPNTWAAVGILLYGAGATSVTGNNVHNNMEGLYVQSTDGVTASGNTFSNTRDTAVFVSLSNNGTYATNTITGQPGSYGMYVYDASTNNNVHDNAVRSNDYGVFLDYSGPGAPSGNAFNQNCIADNTVDGMATLGTVGTPVDATNNWWGKINGANPPGHGDKIDPPATINATPFLTAPVAGCPVPADGDGDGFVDASDNCPAIYNPDQANSDQYNYAANLPGTDSRGDACDLNIKGDGYPDSLKISLGKNVSAYCSIMRADINKDGFVNGLDLGFLAVNFLQTFTPTDPANGLDTGIQRVNQNGDSGINGLDLGSFALQFARSVADCP